MAELLVQSESLTNIADSIRKVKGGKGQPLNINPALVLKNASETELGELHEQLTVYYWEWFDFSQSDQLIDDSGGNDADCSYRHFGFKKREDNGQVVPVLYAQDPATEGEYAYLIYDWEPFYYDGQAEINGKTYDKWRNIETGEPQNWTGTGRKYMYTDVIVVLGDRLTLAQMPEAIEGIVKAATSDATARAEDLLRGETAWVNGELITGNIPIKEETDITTEIMIDSQDKILYTKTQIPQGYYKGGSLFLQSNFDVVDGATIVPSTTSQTVVEDAYVNGEIVVRGDANLTSENIKKGVSIFGVAGELEGLKWHIPVINQSRLTPSKVPSYRSDQTYNDPIGYYDLDSLCSIDNMPEEWFVEEQIEDIEQDVTTSGASDFSIVVENQNPYYTLFLFVSIVELRKQPSVPDGNPMQTYSCPVIEVPPNSSNSWSVDSIFGNEHDTWKFSIDGARYEL